MRCTGIRGATTAASNSADSILDATAELLARMVEANRVQPADLAAVTFTVTDDLDAVFPARAARRLGWKDVPLLCAREIPVKGDVRRCIRVLMLWNRASARARVKHVYLRGAEALRGEEGL